MTDIVKPDAHREYTADPIWITVRSIDRRLEKLEGRPEKKAWYDSQLFSSVLSGVILAGFAFVLTGRIEQAAKERELLTSSATNMQSLVLKLWTGDDDSAEAAALALTPFGKYAILPLSESLGRQTSAAAVKGLEALALTNRDDV